MYHHLQPLWYVCDTDSVKVRAFIFLIFKGALYIDPSVRVCVFRKMEIGHRANPSRRDLDVGILLKCCCPRLILCSTSCRILTQTYTA